MYSRFPQYLARPSDGIIFSLNKDSKTYSIKESKDSHPDDLHPEYKFSHLISLDFYQVEEKDFPALKKLGKEYYEFILWISRSDGYGGYKGGTLQEFILMKEKTFKFRRVLQDVIQLSDTCCLYGSTEEDFTKGILDIKELLNKPI